jgi:hypothetical protein
VTDEDFHHHITNATVVVGNMCVGQFLGIRSDIVFQSLKRIRKDITKSLGAEATVYFFERRILNELEYKFQQSTARNRNLTARQIEARKKINENVNASIRRRGLT